ncbi:amidase [Rhizobium rhizoryzae]|uniref:amidase n=1 Tax=Rhizobium rhizoryzae TaxID=451876 RepID=UPI0028B25DDE|nr:amidase [Rhizobium rhizoryzae]
MNSHPSIPPISDAPELCRIDVAALSAAFGSGALSPVEVAEATLARAEEAQSRFNAFTFIDRDGALQAARAAEARWRTGAERSAIDGVPTTLKDIVHVKGWTVRYGSRSTDAAPMLRDAPSVAGLRAGGAVFIGQTTTPEFGWKAVTDSPEFGITRNPWNPELTPGGSSGGAAVASATGAGVLHLGTDGGGSIRVPAAFTGTFGLKPTFGRVPADPPSVFGTVAHIGPMTRSPADARAMLAAMGGRSLRDWSQPWGEMPSLDAQRFDWKGRKVGLWMTPPTGAVDPAIERLILNAARQIETAGAIIEPVFLPGKDLREMFHAHWMAGAASRLAQIPTEMHKDLDPGFVEAAAEGGRLGLGDYIAAQQARARYGAAMDQLLADYELLLSPATACLPFAAGREFPEGSGPERWTKWAGFSYPINLSQQPACTLFCGTAEGLPVGLQIVGPRGMDGFVLDAAEATGGLLAGT